jgi:hypothetical protein
MKKMHSNAGTGRLNGGLGRLAVRLIIFCVVCIPATGLGCGSDKPEPSPKVEAVAPPEEGRVDTQPTGVLSKPRRMKSEVNEVLDKEAADRARQMDEIFK